MRGKTIIRCARCHVGSDVRLILVFKGVKECMSCAAIEGILRKGHQEVVKINSEQIIRETFEDGDRLVSDLEKAE